MSSSHNPASSASAAAGSSRTITLTSPPTRSDTDGILRLRPSASVSATTSTSTAPSRRVVWTDETVDNEGLGRKKSKICCIYHKPKAFDESSDESSSGSASESESDASDSDSSGASNDGPSLSKGLKEKLNGHRHAEGEHGEACAGRASGKSRRTKQSKGKVRSSAGTQTMTEKSADDGRSGNDESDAEDDGKEFRPNAYERGTR